MIVFGWNRGQREEAELGKTTQTFVQIPTGRLKSRIAQLCEQYGIEFIETEESYTSKSSILDNDLLPTFGEKPEGLQFKGKRLKRGLFRTAKNFLINADANGAANVIKKVAITLGLDLKEISRVCLTTPQRLFIWKNPTRF